MYNPACKKWGGNDLAIPTTQRKRQSTTQTTMGTRMRVILHWLLIQVNARVPRLVMAVFILLGGWDLL